MLVLNILFTHINNYLITMAHKYILPVVYIEIKYTFFRVGQRRRKVLQWKIGGYEAEVIFFITFTSAHIQNFKKVHHSYYNKL